MCFLAIINSTNSTDYSIHSNTFHYWSQSFSSHHYFFTSSSLSSSSNTINFPVMTCWWKHVTHFWVKHHRKNLWLAFGLHLDDGWWWKTITWHTHSFSKLNRESISIWIGFIINRLVVTMWHWRRREEFGYKNWTALLWPLMLSSLSGIILTVHTFQVSSILQVLLVPIMMTLSFRLVTNMASLWLIQVFAFSIIKSKWEVQIACISCVPVGYGNKNEQRKCQWIDDELNCLIIQCFG